MPVEQFPYSFVDLILQRVLGFKRFGETALFYHYWLEDDNSKRLMVPKKETLDYSIVREIAYRSGCPEQKFMEFLKFLQKTKDEE